jgi:hypothetical protein
MFRVLFGSVVVVIGRVQRVAVGDFRVVRRFLVVAGLVMLCRFAMMLRRFIVMVSGFLMMLVDVVIHDPLLGWEAAPLQAVMKHLRPECCREKLARRALGLNRNKRTNSVDDELDGKRGKHHAKKPR